MSRNKVSPVRKLPDKCHDCKCVISGTENQPNGRPGIHKVNTQYYWRCGQCKHQQEPSYEWQSKYGATHIYGFPCDEDGKGTTIDKVVKFRTGHRMVVDEDTGEETKQPVFVTAGKNAHKFKPERNLREGRINASEEKFKYENKQATQSSTDAILDLFG